MSKVFKTYDDIARGFENVVNGMGIECGNGFSRSQPYNIIDDYMNSKVKIDYYRPLTSHRFKFMRIVIFFKRVIRKLNRFLMEPICNDVSEFNKIASMEFKRMGMYVNCLNARIEQLEEELREMRLDDDKNEFYRKYYEYHNKSEK